MGRSVLRMRMAIVHSRLFEPSLKYRTYAYYELFHFGNAATAEYRTASGGVPGSRLWPGWLRSSRRREPRCPRVLRARGLTGVVVALVQARTGLFHGYGELCDLVTGVSFDGPLCKVRSSAGDFGILTS